MVFPSLYMGHESELTSLATSQSFSLYFNGRISIRIANTQMDYCIFKTEHMARKITITVVNYFFSLK